METDHWGEGQRLNLRQPRAQGLGQGLGGPQKAPNVRKEDSSVQRVRKEAFLDQPQAREPGRETC